MFLKNYEEFLKESLLDKLKGVDEDDALKNNPTSVMKHALHNDNIPLFNKALEHGADININHGILLQIYSQAGNYEKVKLLIDNGADPNANEYISDAAIVVASKNGYADIVKLLLDNGACTDAYSRDLKQAKLIATNKSIGKYISEEKRKEYRLIIKYLDDFEWENDDF